MLLVADANLVRKVNVGKKKAFRLSIRRLHKMAKIKYVIQEN